jgi:hypothetical protein
MCCLIKGMRDEELVYVSCRCACESRTERLELRNRLLSRLLGWEGTPDRVFDVAARRIQRAWHRTRSQRERLQRTAVLIQRCWRHHRCILDAYTTACAMDVLRGYALRRRRRTAAMRVQRAYRERRAPMSIPTNTLRQLIRNHVGVCKKNEQMSRVMIKMLVFMTDRLSDQ